MIETQDDPVVRRFSPILAGLTLDQAIELFIKHLEGASRSKQTIEAYQRRFKRFKSHPGFAGCLPLTAFSPEDLDSWAVALRQDDLSDASRLGYIQAVKTLFAFSHRRGYISIDPASDLVRPKLNHSARGKVMLRSDFYRLLDMAWKKAEQGNYRDLALLCFMGDTGARRGEVCTLTTDNLNLTDCEAWITGKTGPGLVDFTEETADILRTYIGNRRGYVFLSVEHGFGTGKPLTPSGINSVFRLLGKQAKVRGRVNPHSLRHLVGQWWNDNVKNLELLRRKLRHANVNVTAMFYSHQDMTRVKAATKLHSLTNDYTREG